ncbi:NUMOD3 domain-containing DNA-binding protein [Ensifer sesbaniae]|uniref:NUMOD3 domain-containing DNA-binding protein n=1 Tax=Ensifer sesbaniae TaxID=1214071 RepID=UPI0020009541|nr:NUMOD3 domain-containing DNA-binding protein [Ensifer sesbaniae]
MFDIFKRSNYTASYVHLIRRAKRENRRKGDGTYYESHHIVPKSLGGSNRKFNRVLLTAEEHLRAHLLLPEMVSSAYHKHKMACALSRMVHGNREQRKAGAIQFSLIARKKMAETTAGENNPMFGRQHTAEARQKVSESKIGIKHPLFSGFYHTPWGTYESSHQAAIASDGLMKQPAVHRYCGNPDTVITKVSFALNHYLREYHDESVIGRTWRSINFFFEPAQSAPLLNS